MNGLISIIIPVYNVEQYLRKCLDSVLAQNYQKYEVIMVNDGSTDQSVDICEEYIERDNRFQLIVQKNAGASAARNKGLHYAKGEYVYFLDSDDWLENTALEEFINCINQEGADFVFFDAYAVDETKGIKSDKFYSHKKQYQSDNGTNVMDKLLSNKEFHVTPWHMFFKKRFLTEHQIFFKEGIIYEDMLFAYQVFSKADKVTYLPKFLYFRRFREDSVMTSQVRIHNFESARKVYYYVKEHTDLLEDERKNKNYVVRCAYNGLNIYQRLNEDDKKTVYENYRRLKKDILENEAFGDVSLRLYCHNKALWMIYKIMKKIQGMIFRKAK